MNPIIAQVCQRRSVRPEQFFGIEKASHVVAARCDAIQRLKRAGLGPQKIANETKLHVQTVYYWLRPVRRARIRKQSDITFRLKAIGGKRQTKQQRQEILEAYLEDPCKGTALACGRGLSPLYAYKLALALGVLPRKDEK
jgi:hypothetical protein